MSTIGFPDGQRITQWLGTPFVQAAALAIGNVLHTDGPFAVSSWASIVVAVKATGGNVTVTVKQQVSRGPAALELDQSFVVPAGGTTFEALVLFGDAVTLTMLGSAPGVTVDYAVYPSNSTTNAQVLTRATIDVQHNNVLVGAEAAIDIVDALTFPLSVVDDGPNGRLVITPPAGVLRQLANVSPQSVVNNVADNSLLGGGVVIPAGVLGAGGVARLTCGGSFQQAVGPPQNLPRFRVNFNGAPVVIDTGVLGAGAGVSSSASFFAWQAVIEVNLVPSSGLTQVNLRMIGTAQSGVGGNVGATVLTGNGAWRLVDGMWWVEANVSNLALNWAIAESLDFRVINAFASPAYGTYLDYAKLDVAGV